MADVSGLLVGIVNYFFYFFFVFRFAFKGTQIWNDDAEDERTLYISSDVERQMDGATPPVSFMPIFMVMMCLDFLVCVARGVCYAVHKM